MRRHLILFFVFFLLSSLVYSQPPQLPTIFYGQIVDGNSNPLPGVEVSAEWMDDLGEGHSTNTISITKEQAIELGDGTLEGYYFFNLGNILAVSGSSIFVSVSGSENVIVKSSPGGMPFKVGQNIVVDSPIVQSSGEDDFFSRLRDWFQDLFDQGDKQTESSDEDSFDSSEGDLEDSPEESESSLGVGEGSNTKGVTGEGAFGISLAEEEEGTEVESDGSEDTPSFGVSSSSSSGDASGESKEGDNTITYDIDNKADPSSSSKAIESMEEKEEGNEEEESKEDQSKEKESSDLKEEENKSEEDSSVDTLSGEGDLIEGEKEPEKKLIQENVSEKKEFKIPKIFFILGYVLAGFFVVLIIFYSLFKVTVYAAKRDVQKRLEKVISAPIKDVMSEKLISVNKEDKLIDALHIMMKEQINTLAVVDNNKIEGVLSENDIINMDSFNKLDSVRVEDVMGLRYSCIDLKGNIYDAVKMMKKDKARKLVVMSVGQPIGMLTQKDIMEHLYSENVTDGLVNLDNIMSIDSIITEKIVSLPKESSVEEALALMRSSRVSDVIVMVGHKVDGIFTSEDFLRQLLKDPENVFSLNLDEVMSKPVFTMDDDLSIFDAGVHMRQKGYRHFVVMKDKKVVGMIVQRKLFFALYSFFYRYASSKFKRHLSS